MGVPWDTEGPVNDPECDVGCNFLDVRRIIATIRQSKVNLECDKWSSSSRYSSSRDTLTAGQDQLQRHLLDTGQLNQASHQHQWKPILWCLVFGVPPRLFTNWTRSGQNIAKRAQHRVFHGLRKFLVGFIKEICTLGIVVDSLHDSTSWSRFYIVYFLQWERLQCDFVSLETLSPVDKVSMFDARNRSSTMRNRYFLSGKTKHILSNPTQKNPSYFAVPIDLRSPKTLF